MAHEHRQKATAPAIEADAPQRIPVHGAAPSSRLLSIICFGFMVAAWYAVVGPKVQLSQWTIRAENNAAMREALAWQAGRLDLPTNSADPLRDRLHDTAFVRDTGEVFNVFPPLTTFFCYAVNALQRPLLGEAPGLIGPLTYATAWVLPLLLVCFWAFRTQTNDPRWGGFLAFALLCGTALYPLMVWSRGGNVGYMHHVASQIGLLLIAGDLLGRRRIWPAAIGLLIAAWSRQFTIAYAVPIFMAVAQAPRRGRALGIATAATVLAAGVLMLLNQLKFGSPFETGYALIYEGRPDDAMLATRARQGGLFALRWMPENLSYMLWNPPDAEWTHQGLQLAGDARGNGLLFTTPIVVLVFATARQWWREPMRRWCMLATLPVVIGILCYHTMGFISTACYRFGMDYLAVWLMVAAPALVTPRWRWWTMGCVAWSVVYFQAVRFPVSV